MKIQQYFLESCQLKRKKLCQLLIFALRRREGRGWWAKLGWVEFWRSKRIVIARKPQSVVGKLTQYWNYDQKREVYFNNLNILIVGQYERERERTRRVNGNSKFWKIKSRTNFLERVLYIKSLHYLMKNVTKTFPSHDFCLLCKSEEIVPSNIYPGALSKFNPILILTPKKIWIMLKGIKDKIQLFKQKVFFLTLWVI